MHYNWTQLFLTIDCNLLLANFCTYLLDFFFCRLVARCFTNVPKSVNQGLKHLGPMIQERLDMDEKYGMDWEGRPVRLSIPSAYTSTELVFRTT